MSDAISAEFDSQEVTDFLNDLTSRLENVKDGERKYIGLLSAIVYGDVMGHFKGERGSAGPWAKWSKSYRKQMEAKGRGSNKILQFTGKLRNSFKPTNVNMSNAGPVWFNDAQTRTGFPYAAAHDNGGPKLPQRDFMWLSDSAVESISEKTLQFMLDEGI